LLTVKLESKMQYLEEIIFAFYKRQYSSNALILLSANDYQDMIKKSKYASLIAHYDSNLINQYGAEIKRINDKKNELETQQKNLEANKNNAVNRKNKLHADGLKKDKLLARLKARHNMYEAKVRELESSSKKVRNILNSIKAKKIPKSIIGKGFKTLKGQLPWPIDGEILSPYRKDKKLESNTTAFKSGIEIKAKSEDIPVTVAGGRVVYAGIFKGYGKLVIIDHGSGYHSIYGNLSEISLEKGNIVVKGFQVGKILTSKILNVPTLYFEIRHSGRPIDPMDWLKRKI
jgi:septal ring factor EnvC (AmiA/AmiB activator)